MELDVMAHDPQLWSAEEPNLYILVLSLYDEADNLLEAESCQVHFVNPVSFLCYLSCYSLLLCIVYSHV